MPLDYPLPGMYLQHRRRLAAKGLVERADTLLLCSVDEVLAVLHLAKCLCSEGVEGFERDRRGRSIVVLVCQPF